MITGDLVDGTVAVLRDAVAPLAELKAKDGVFFVTGNHEYYSGVDEWLAHLPSLGIRVLRNERVAIGVGPEAFDLAGVDDWSARGLGHGHGPDLPRALDGRDRGRVLILLAHQPKQVIEAAENEVDLQLSGHTHGGQMFPFGLARETAAAVRRRVPPARGDGHLREPRDGLLGAADARRIARGDHPDRALDVLSRSHRPAD